MNECPNCKAVIEPEDMYVTAKAAAHDPTQLDVNIECPHCKVTMFTFIPFSDFIV